MESAFLEPDSPRWAAVLTSARHDFYHLPEYVALCARSENGQPKAYHVRDGRHELLLPLIVRPIDDPPTGPLSDATSPYGYPGPLVVTPESASPESFLHGALHRLQEDFAEAGLVSLFLRSHPLLPLYEDTLKDFGLPVLHGETVSCDLRLSPAELWRQTRRDHRRNINRSRRAGHVARMDERWEHFESFLAIYEETMDRVDATSSYYFSADYFTSLRAVLRERLHLCVVEIDGAVAAAGLFTEVDGTVQFHLSGTKNVFLRERPSKLMLDYVRTWAKERGNVRLHLGGGVGAARDSLFDFKSGFSDLRHPFHTFRAVCDRDAYSALVSSRAPGRDPDDLSGYFPPYRRPAPT